MIARALIFVLPSKQAIANAMRLYPAPLAIAAATVSMALTAGCALDPSEAKCSYNNEDYSQGETFPSADGCNSCSCTEAGQVACTERACLPSCEVDGTVRAVGESFPAGDGCNTCTCSGDGLAACTLIDCTPQGDSCGGIQGLVCPEGYFCSHEPEAQCGAADQLGQCQQVPEVCGEIYQPVCGCDGLTYSNRCFATRAGTSVASTGVCAGSECSVDSDCPLPDCACLDEDEDGQCDNTCQDAFVCSDGRCVIERDVAPEPPSLGASCSNQLAGSNPCGEGRFCQFQPGGQCGAADASGVCVEIAEVCVTIYDPVCGCDGTTYSNSCVAAAAQAHISAQGSCPE